MKSLECDICKKERCKRTAVATGNDDERFQQHPFSTAPYVHPQNDPQPAAQSCAAQICLLALLAIVGIAGYVIQSAANENQDHFPQLTQKQRVNIYGKTSQDGHL